MHRSSHVSPHSLPRVSRSSRPPTNSEDGVDFHHLFAHFPINSPVSRYLCDLDLDQLLENLRLAATPLANVPYYCRAEALRRREAARVELSMLDDAFADIERRGVAVGHLRANLRQARARLEACIREDNAWSDSASSPSSSPASSVSFELPPSQAHARHRRSTSEPVAFGSPVAAVRATPPATRRMSTGSPAWHPSQFVSHPRHPAGPPAVPIPAPRRQQRTVRFA